MFMKKPKIEITESDITIYGSNSFLMNSLLHLFIGLLEEGKFNDKLLHAFVDFAALPEKDRDNENSEGRKAFERACVENIECLINVKDGKVVKNK